MEVELKVTGLKELMESMEDFCSPKLQQKLVSGALKAAAKVIVDQAEANLGKGKGHVGAGIPRKGSWVSSTFAAISIGIKSKHWTDIFTEYGKHVARYTKKGAYRGLSRSAKPFLRPAIDTKKQAALDMMTKWLSYAIDTIFMARRRDIDEPPIDLT